MARVSTYLNFPRETEAAFEFYRSVFGTEYVGEVSRFGDAPSSPEGPQIPEEDKNLVLHVALPILAGHMLMGSDAPESLGMSVTVGNNVQINLEPDTRDETRALFAALGEGGKVEMELAEQFWGDYFGSLIDRFGINWLFNCTAKE